MKSLTSTLLLSIWVLAAHAKDYTKYYQLINQAEEAFVNNNKAGAFALYDKAFKAYNKPFLKDCYIAAQMAYAGGDTSKFLDYMALSFRNGMPLTAYPAAKILRNTMDNEELYSRIKKLYETNFHKFNPDIQHADELELISYTNDSLKKLAGNDTAAILRFNAHEEMFRRYINEHYISKGMFPSEKMFGVTSEESREDFRERMHKEPLFDKAQFEKDFKLNGLNVKISDAPREEYSLRYTTGYNVFVHSTCAWQEYKDKLWQTVLNGYLSPKEFGLLYETSVSWNRMRLVHLLNKMCDYEPESAYFNILYKDPFRKHTYVEEPELVAIVEANRAQYLMQKFSVDVQKKKLEKEFGFKFFFGFMNLS